VPASASIAPDDAVNANQACSSSCFDAETKVHAIQDRGPSLVDLIAAVIQFVPDFGLSGKRNCRLVDGE